MATHTCSGSTLGPLAAALFCTCIEQNEFLIFLTELTGKLQRTCGGDASLKRTQTSLTRHNLAVAMLLDASRTRLCTCCVPAQLFKGRLSHPNTGNYRDDCVRLSACIPLLGVLSERIPPLCPA